VNVARDIFVHENDLITLMVNKTEDTDDGSCNNDCSLREAIGAVSAGGTVTFAPALAGQTIPLSSTITIDKNLIIDGSDLVPHVQVSGDTDDNGMGDISLFQIAEGKTVEITSLDIIKGLSTLWSTGGGITNRGDLTLTNCSFVGNNGQQGGAIRNAGSLTISNCSFTENAAKDGGAIYNDINKIIQISDSSFTMNTADYAAGAILNVGTLSATGSEFSNNSGGIAGGGGAIVNSLLGSVSLQDNTFTDNSTPWYGGAINNYSGTLTVTDCTFSGNSAEGGGAINAGNDDHTPESNNIRIENSTFSENTATFIAGGGLHVFSGNAIVNGSTFSNNLAPEGGGVVNLASALQISNSTFYNNTSIESPLGGIYNNGSITVKNVTISEKDGGLYNASGGTLELQNTILANSITGYDCYNAGTLTNATNNLIEANSSGEFACGTPVSSADPLLGPLADNGGPTQTMALRPGSPAIDAGDDTNCPPTDQRGKARPQNAHCDIGAFELELNLTFVVNSSLDIVDANQGDGVCETSTGNGLCTLRAAIQEANANLGIDHIILPEGIYSLTLPEPVGTIENAAANGDLDILDTLFLSGAGSASTVIDGNGDVTQDRVFDIRGNHDVEISNLTIRGGNPAPNNGGGIYNRGGMLTLNTIVLRDNTAGLGGGLINVGTTHLINSSIESNTATDNGGGIRNDLALFIVNSSVSGNTSRSAGGGIITHGLLQVTNSTISGNQTEDDRGGGIFVGNTLVGEPDPTVNLNNVTIVNNLADSDGNGNGDGGGIYLRENGTVYLRNTILAGNAGPNGVSECSGTLTSKGHNLIEKTGNCIIIGSTTGNLVGVDPNLGPLADNGGPTQSMALLPGSPAIDAGDNTACPSADQRGAARPQDGDNNGSLICDIGAYEVEPDTTPPNVSSIVRADTDPTSATSIDFTVTFSEPVSGVDASDFKLAKTGSISSYAITGVSPATGPADTYTVSVATGKYNGTLRLDLLDDDSIKDGGGNPLGGAGNGNGDFISGEAYTITKKYTSTLKSIATQDGWLLESSETSNKGGTLDKTANLFYLGDNAQNKQYRSVLSFSTKGLPDDARVTKVTLKIRKQGIVGSGNPVNLFQGFLVDVKQGFFGTAAGLQASNFQAKADQSIGPFKPTLISGWYALNLTSAKAYINKKATGGGVTQIRLRFKLDDNNNSIANNLKLYSGDAPAASHPQLILEYYVP
jgi:CSLREA domain-containing protein